MTVSRPLGDAVLEALMTAVAERTPVVLVTITTTDRSVPRRPGTKMLVHSDGATVGTVGGGEMEARVRAEAMASLVDGSPRNLSYTLLDPSTGDPGVCGGQVELFLEPYMPSTQLLVVGAGHVGRAVAELAGWLELEVMVWDDRAELLADVPDGVSTFSGPVAEVAERVDAQTAVVLLTRNVALDVELLPVLLATDSPLVGVMGSARRWSTTRDLLIGAGVTEAQLSRVRTPVGVEIGAESPKQIAISVLAQIIDEGP